MRYRNDTGYPQLVNLQPPVVVEPGDAVDHDEHIIGLTLVDETPPDPAPAEPAPVTTRKKSTPAPASADGPEV